MIIRCDDVFVDTDPKAVDAIWSLITGFGFKHIIAVTPQGRGDAIHHKKPLKRGNAWIREHSGEHFIFENKELLEVLWLYQQLGARIAIHGLKHIDYRQLSYKEQLFDLRVAKGVMDALFGEVRYFVPPFNKYNEDTQKVCDRLGLELVPTYYEADTKVCKGDKLAIQKIAAEAIKLGNCAYHPYYLQGGWEKSEQEIRGKTYRKGRARWNLDDSIEKWRYFLSLMITEDVIF